MRKIIISAIFIFCIYNIGTAQVLKEGSVKDENDQPVFAASVYLISDPSSGVNTDLEGNFIIDISQLPDTMVISYIGYETENILIKDSSFLEVILATDQIAFEAVTIQARNPISESFAVNKVEKMEIYFNPLAQGDALKAISASSYSTTSDESASPSLRGSSAARTNVIFNKVPIYNPVRNSQINGIGNFSIFNTEIIGKQYVYPSNPPLNYGNSSAGLIDIESNLKLLNDNLQVTTNIAGMGLLLSKSTGENQFVQAFANVQFSSFFKYLNASSTHNLNAFNSKDVGLNFHTQVGKDWTYNAFAYAIDESYDVTLNQFAFEASAHATKTRIFTIHNLERSLGQGLLDFNYGLSTAKSDFAYGNIHSKQGNQQHYFSANYKHFFKNDLVLQVGLSFDGQFFSFKDSIPTFYYALSPSSPNDYMADKSTNNLFESYTYIRKPFAKEWNLSLGLRSDFDFLSGQLGLNYSPSLYHNVLLSAGQYNSFSRPNFIAKNFKKLESKQVSLDYTYNSNSLNLQAAIYYKDESGERTLDRYFEVEKLTTFGIEIFIKRSITRYLEVQVANSFIDQKQYIFGKDYPGEFDFNYFLKAAIVMRHPKLPSMTLSYIGRPGQRYNKISSGLYQESLHTHLPVFADDIYGSKFGSYKRFDLALNKYFSFQNYSIVAFASIANILDAKNELAPTYNVDYSEINFNYYQERSLFLGVLVDFQR